MTSIGSINISKTGEKVIFSDGMASAPDSKIDGYQKLYRVGDNLVVATGSTNQITSIVKTLSNDRGFSGTAEALSKAIKQQVDSLTFNNSGIAFLIAGQGSSSNFIVEKNSYNGNHYDFEGEANPVVVRGSGRRFTEAYLRGLGKSGRIVAPQTLKDGLSLMYKLGKEGAEDIGVNDKLQFGVITKNSITRLYDSDVVFYDDQDYLDYIKEFTGLVLPKIESNADWIQPDNANPRFELESILNTVYAYVMQDLNENNIREFRHIQSADAYARNLVEETTYSTALAERRAQYDKLDALLPVFVDPNIGSIRSYINKKLGEIKKSQNEFFKQYMNR